MRVSLAINQGKLPGPGPEPVDCLVQHWPAAPCPGLSGDDPDVGVTAEVAAGQEAVNVLKTLLDDDNRSVLIPESTTDPVNFDADSSIERLKHLVNIIVFKDYQDPHLSYRGDCSWKRNCFILLNSHMYLKVSVSLNLVSCVPAMYLMTGM